MMAKIRKLAKQYPKAFHAALFSVSVDIMNATIPRTPIDQGDLRASAFVSEPIKTGNGAAIVLGFGAEHAIFVHEKLGVNHPIGEAKFLERTFREMAPSLAKKIADETAAQVKAGRVSLKNSPFATEPNQ